MKESHPFFLSLRLLLFFLEYDVSFTCFSVRFDCAFIFFKTATLDNVSGMVSGKVFQASFRPVSDLFWAWHWLSQLQIFD